MEVPLCSHHPSSQVVRAGWYGKVPHRRQRWLCRPVNGDPSHRFSELLPREEAETDHCAHCTTELEQWEGHNGPREYWFRAREIAHALFLVSKGVSYYKAGQGARVLGERLRDHQPRGGVYPARKPHYSNESQIVCNWVDVFAPVIYAGELPTEWPARIAVDSAGFVTTQMASQRAGKSFNVLAAVGYEPGREKHPKVWRIMPAPRRDTTAYERFFEGLSGTPERIVTDADPTARSAAQNIFPRGSAHPPRLYYCEDHLRRIVISKLPPLVRYDEKHPMMIAMKYAFTGSNGFQNFETQGRALIAQQRAHLFGTWMDQWFKTVRDQTYNRPRQRPWSIGATEAVLRDIKVALSDRSPMMTNLKRAEKLLNLIQLDLNKQLNEIAWAEKIREDLVHRAGYAATHQRPHDDPKGYWSLVS